VTGEANTADDKVAEVEYLEYLGDPKYGTEFLTSHAIRPVDAKEAGWSTKLDKDVVWTRREGGRHKGRMLLPTADLPAGVTEELANDPAFKVVSLKG